MTPLLSARQVSVSFDGLRALVDVSLDVEPGRIAGLIGPNGAGKTTLFNVLSGLLDPDFGSVWFDGRDITGVPVAERAALGIGRSFQNLGLMQEETVLTNVLAAQHAAPWNRLIDAFLLPWRWRRTEARLASNARRALAAFGVHGVAEQRVRDLSFAAARFVELAAVVVQRPRLLLLDEPTTGLDIDETNRLAEVLRALRGDGTTVLLVAHDVRFVMSLCDDVYVLAEGALIEHGPPAAVQRSPVVAAAYLGRST